jgi:hypothetical protein
MVPKLSRLGLLDETIAPPEFSRLGASGGLNTLPPECSRLGRLDDTRMPPEHSLAGTGRCFDLLNELSSSAAPEPEP